MTDLLVLDMPMKTELEFMVVVGSDFANAEWEFVDDIIDGVDGIRLVMAFVNRHSPHTYGIVDGRELAAFLSFETVSL